MHILQAHKYYWERDGASKYALFLSRLLTDKGHTIIPFAMKENETLTSPYNNYFVSSMDLAHPNHVSFLDKFFFAGRMMYSFEAKKKMRALLREHRVDLAHIHNIYHHISPSILVEIKKHKIPIVMTLHDYKLLSPNYTLFHHGRVREEDASGWYLSCVKNKCMKNSRAQSMVVTAEMIFHHKIMKYYERYVDKFIAPSEFIMNLCIRHGWPKHAFVHIPHPISSTSFKSSKEEGVYALYIGRLSEEKGLDVLLDAAKKTPHIPYRIAGFGPLEAHLTARVAKENISNVVFGGFKTGKALDMLLAHARILIVPSLWYENYPLAILEAKALGKIVIGSDIGGMRELLPDDLLVPPGNPDLLAKKIQSWYSAPFATQEKMGLELQEQAQRVNDSSLHVERALSVYHDLLK